MFIKNNTLFFKERTTYKSSVDTYGKSLLYLKAGLFRKESRLYGQCLLGRVEVAS